MGCCAIGRRTLLSVVGLAPLGDEELLPASVGEAMTLLIADVVFGTASEREAGLAMSFAFQRYHNHS